MCRTTPEGRKSGTVSFILCAGVLRVVWRKCKAIAAKRLTSEELKNAQRCVSLKVIVWLVYAEWEMYNAQQK